jgi:hypothetical protein
MGRASGVLVGFALASAGLAPTAAAAPRLVLEPSQGALVTHAAARVEVARTPGRATRVRLNRRDVTARMHVSGGRLVATLRPRDGLRAGLNRLTVTAGAGRTQRVNVRTFYLVRFSRSFARARLTGTNPSVLRIRIISGGSRRVLARRAHVLRVVLNGRSVSRALVPQDGISWAATFSGSHGVRHGRNRIKIFVAEPQSGRYASVSYPFFVSRSRPLAAAGYDQTTRPNVRVRVGGPHRAANQGALSYRWSIVSRPAASRAAISAPSAPRPSLVPDRPGRYVLRVRVAERATGRTVRAVGPAAATSDEVTVDVAPKTTLFPLAVNAFGTGPRGIKVGDTLYRNTGPAGAIQVLALDRRTLEPTDAGNFWCCDANDPQHSLTHLSSVVDDSTPRVLLVIAVPPNQQVLARRDYEAFSEVLAAAGVRPMPARDLDGQPARPAAAKDGEQIVAVGIPNAPVGTGWLVRADTPNPEFETEGWLMPDGSLTSGYRFQPLQIPFDTSVAKTDATNTMQFGEHTVTSPPIGTPTGYHLVEVSSADLHVVRNLAFDNSPAGRKQLSAAVTAANERDEVGDLTGRGDYVALQSIGGFAPADPGWSDRSRDGNVNYALLEIGANPGYFNLRSGSYAFFGGAHLGRKGAAQSNGGLTVDAGSTVRQRGALRGEVRMAPDGYLLPPGGEAGEDPAASLYHEVFETGTAEAWPYTSGPDAERYAAALAYISGRLAVDPAYGRDLKPYSTDIRGAYVGLPNFGDWKAVTTALAGTVHYPGQRAGVCDAQGNATRRLASVGAGFTPDQFCQVKRQLELEFVALDDTKTLQDLVVQAMTLAGFGDTATLHTVFKTIKDKVAPPEDAEFAGPILGLIRSLGEIAELAEIEAGPLVSVAASLIQDVVEITSAVQSDGVVPIGEALQESADDLQADILGAVAGGAQGFDAIRLTAMSNWGRLQALQGVYDTYKSLSTSDVVNELEHTTGRFFTSSLVESLQAGGRYRGVRIRTDGTGANGGPDPVDCRYKYRNITPGAWVPLLYRLDDWSSLVYGYSGTFNTDFPPEDVLQQMFGSPSRGGRIPGLGNGYGIDKLTWFWQQADRDTAAFGNFDDCRL